jgi:alpha-ketoglutarate-dependent taurine dioxygenase
MRRVYATAEILSVEWADGQVDAFPSLWLRDNMGEERDPHSGQRLVDIADLPEQPRIRSAATQDGTVRIEWEGETRAAVFDVDWLASYSGEPHQRQPERVPRRWLEGASLDARRDFAWTGFADARAHRNERLAWLTRLLQEGIAFMRAVPCDEKAILDATRLAGQVIETNYGLVFDVRSVPQPENLAYSDLGLGLHTDNPYRDPVPGFQALHALLASPDGGDSVFADGYALAEHLRTIDPDAFALLTRVPVPFHYRSKDAELYTERPLIQLSSSGAVSAVHYNSRSIAPLRLASCDVTAFYVAYRRFAALLREPRFQLRMRLTDGDLVVFDNQRILHGRTAFSTAKHARHLRGCYLARDSVYGAAALLRRALNSEKSDAGE